MTASCRSATSWPGTPNRRRRPQHNGHSNGNGNGHGNGHGNGSGGHVGFDEPGLPRLWRNMSSIRLLVASYVACLVFSLLYCLFIYHVLIRRHPQVGGVLFDAPTSNLLISIFSQVFVLLSDAMICRLLDTIRAALASRDGGTSASAFFGLSSATGWLSVLRLSIVNGFRDLWCNFRCFPPGPRASTSSKTSRS